VFNSECESLFKLSRNRQPPEPAYPIDFSWFSKAVLAGNKGRFSSDGSLLINYGPHVGWQRNPTSQAILCLGLMQMWSRTRNEEILSLVLKSAHSLLRLGQRTGSHSLGFPILFKPVGYGLEVPWFSALSQGFGASVFCRVSALVRDPAWLEHGGSCLDFVLETPKLTSCDSTSGGLWFEEAPTSPPLHILNGHIYCTIAFHEAGEFSGDERYARCFEMGINALAGNLPKFDMGGISYYDAVRKIPAKPYYQKLHVEQLDFLREVTGNTILGSYANRWRTRMLERWMPSTWLLYIKQTSISGLQSDGLCFPPNAILYSLGENGFGPRLRETIGRIGKLS
jgi:hypothetical protein